MGNTDDPIKTRMENRLARLGDARKTMEIIRQRFEQIKRRAPFLKVIADGGLDNLNEALTLINREWEETRRERWPAGKEER